ncbi:MAG: tRNA (adenosine(37)-N6)-threonylcarbamoyltransferase complex dimerization subunit type 1 TsaB [Flavobacteriaceae bacterium]|nr:tRNA (adenosine(37)-N6)-threonylcarbamoyltransferase complex dimerization subunit type 1 TsaB [Flavobacteriaceae bacterium]
MAYILHLETSTKQCSVALAHKGELLASRILLNESFSHSEKLHLFISEVLQEAKLKSADLDAVAVSKGPGSYTGLRIGVAAAKGLCFGLDIPLIALNALKILAQASTEQNTDYIIPMMDARRMEVYTAVFDSRRNWVEDTSALVLSRDSFKELLKDQTVLVLGDGAQKFKELNPEINAVFPSEIFYPKAVDMISLAWEKFNSQVFVSLAYFEPFYLKDFQTTPPKKNLGV